MCAWGLCEYGIRLRHLMMVRVLYNIYAWLFLCWYNRMHECYLYIWNNCALSFSYHGCYVHPRSLMEFLYNDSRKIKLDWWLISYASTSFIDFSLRHDFAFPTAYTKTSLEICFLATPSQSFVTCFPLVIPIVRVSSHCPANICPHPLSLLPLSHPDCPGFRSPVLLVFVLIT